MGLKIGIDTGGTYTDAVLMDDTTVLASAKSLTTREDLGLGISRALQKVLDGAQASAIDFVSLSTTLATNAIVEGQGGRVALVLIGFEPEALNRAGLGEAMQGQPVIFVDGGHKATGEPRCALDAESLRQQITDVHAHTGVDAVAISAFFAVRNPEHEIQARDIVHEATGLPVSCGFELASRLDAPRRALTAAINARLIPVLAQLMQRAQATLDDLGVAAPLMVVKGDGSLMRAVVAARSPVETILSGPAASVVGARFISGEQDVIVADMGGTTTDIAFLDAGQPRLSTLGAQVGGYQTMVSAVQVHTCGLGGDSWVRYDRETKDLALGPTRVVPLCITAAQYPDTLTVMQDVIDGGYLRTHDGLFATRREGVADIKKMSSKQRDLWARLGDAPVSVQAAFRDQTLDRALHRFIERGWISISAFTPTDAAHILGLSTEWADSLKASQLGACILAHYMRNSHGPDLGDDPATLAAYVRARVSARASDAIINAAVGEHSGTLHSQLPAAQQALFNLALGRDRAQAFDLRLHFRHALAGIGAPAHSYLPETAQQLGTSYCAPQHAEVANAIGAVVGLVKQSASATITPLSARSFRLHTPEGNSDFNSLEEAAHAAMQCLSRIASERARDAGAVDFDLSEQRHDVIVDQDGEKVFFESQLSVHATGRPAL